MELEKSDIDMDMEYGLMPSRTWLANQSAGFVGFILKGRSTPSIKPPSIANPYKSIWIWTERLWIWIWSCQNRSISI